MRGCCLLILLVGWYSILPAMQKHDAESIRLIELLDSGAVYLEQGNYTQALQQFNTCLQLSDKSKENHTREKVLAYFNIGNIHSVFSDFEHAYTHYLKGYQMCKTLNDPEMEFKFLNNMTGICCFMKKSNEAIKYNEIAKQLPLSNKYIQEYTYVLNKGYIAASMNDSDSALVNFRESIRLAEKYDLNAQFIAAPYSEIYLIYESAQQLDSAIYYLKKYNKIVEDNNFAYMIIDSYKNLMRVYTKKGDKEAALHYQDRYFQLSDSFMNLRDFYKIKNEQQAYETNLSDQEIQSLNFKLSAWQMILLFMGLVLLISMGFIFFIYKQKKKLQEAYQHLFDRNGELIQIERHYKNLLNSKKTEIGANLNTSAVEPNSKQSDSIDAEKKVQILNDINDIMETSDDFCNPTFSLSTLAKMVNSNTKYVSQIINETYGKNFRTFINEYRVKEARKRLMEEKYTNYTIQSISESVGYKSCTNFILAFKKVTGMTPSLYQKIAKNKKRSSEIQ